MLYFAMIDGEQRGPYELEQLPEAGVRPDTYVWCKDMDGWEKAEDVADICRFFRQRIFDLMHPQAPRPQAPAQSGEGQQPPFDQVPLRYRYFFRQSGQTPEIPPEPTPDTSVPPMSTMLVATLLTIFCFPPTGLVAIYYSMMARKAWGEASRSEARNSRRLYSDQEREELRKEAHDYSRQAKMWIGITFFLGIILYAFLGHKLA